MDNTNNIENDKKETIPEIQQISPPEMPTTTNSKQTANNMISSYGAITGQSQSVSSSRFNPITNTNTKTTTITNTTNGTETKQNEQLLNQYSYYLPSTATATATAATATSLPPTVLPPAILPTATATATATAAAQQYLLYNQLSSYNAAILRAQLMAQRAAQLQTLSSASQKWVLFVFHLPEDMDDNGLLLLFSPFGATQAIVMRHKNTDCSRGFGFIHFRTKNDAQIAIDMMNGYQIGHKRLRVSFKKSKD